MFVSLITKVRTEYMNKTKSHSLEVFRLPKIVPNVAKANAGRISMESFAVRKRQCQGVYK